MATINIGLNNQDDPFYRYKRPVCQVQVIRKTTQLLNLGLLAKALHCPPEAVVKHLKKACGCNVSWVKEVCIINGVWTMEAIESKIEDFITAHVLCPVCGLPELVGTRCNACGNSRRS